MNNDVKKEKMNLKQYVFQQKQDEIMNNVSKLTKKEKQCYDDVKLLMKQLANEDLLANDLINLNKKINALLSEIKNVKVFIFLKDQVNVIYKRQLDILTNKDVYKLNINQ